MKYSKFKGNHELSSTAFHYSDQDPYLDYAKLPLTGELAMIFSSIGVKLLFEPRKKLKAC